MPNYPKILINTGEKYEPLWKHVITLVRVLNFKHFCAYIFARNFQDICPMLQKSVDFSPC